jgi:hypothetical protein
MSRRGAALAALAVLAFGALAHAAAPVDSLQVLGVDGRLKRWVYETEPWPLEPGNRLGDGDRVELSAGALLRLRYAHYLDLAVAGPARLSVYAVHLPQGERQSVRLVLRLDQGQLLIDGRFQFDRPADLVLGLPESSFPLPLDARCLVDVQGGHSRCYLPLTPAAAGLAVPAALSGSAWVAEPGAQPAAVPGLAPALFKALDAPVRLFVIARDFDQDLGQWPRPPVLGPLLTERLGRIPGLQMVDGSGSTAYAYEANNALKTGDDLWLKELGRRLGARWVLAGNDVSLTPPSESAPSRRAVLGQAEVRLLEVEAGSEGQELVSEAANTRVARAGRALELASRQAQEAVADQVAGYLDWSLRRLLQGQAHAPSVLKLVLENATPDAVQALRWRLSSLDAVSRYFRRAYAQKVISFDLLLRKDEAGLDAQWAAAPGVGWRFKLLESAPGLRRYKALAPR